MNQNSFADPKRDLKMTVLFNRPISPRCWHIGLDTGVDTYPAVPGQFVHVRLEDDFDPFLRRPFSICRFREHEGRPVLEMLYIVVGRGTTRMTRYAPGDQVDVLGPLGLPFTVDEKKKHHFLVGGGVGIPPLYNLAEVSLASRSDLESRCFIGGRDKGELYLLDDFESLGVPIHTATDDGSHGHHGYVPDAMMQHIESEALAAEEIQVYTCGPTPMLKVMQKVCNDAGIACQISMEQHMGCAVGVCWACVLDVRLPDGTVGHKRCCCEGPVFDAKELILDGAEHE
jgi:dihydroorotate dehydrogenase electron transfer subunit